MVSKRNVINFAGLAGIVIIVSNNLIQFIETMSRNQTSDIAIVVLATFGVIFNTKIMEKLR